MWRPLSQRSALTPSLVHDLPEVLGQTKCPAAHPPAIYCMHSKKSLHLGSSTLHVIPEATTKRSPPLLSYETPFSSGLVLMVVRRGGGQNPWAMCVWQYVEGVLTKVPKTNHLSLSLYQCCARAALQRCVGCGCSQRPRSGCSCKQPQSRCAFNAIAPSQSNQLAKSAWWTVVVACVQ